MKRWTAILCGLWAALVFVSDPAHAQKRVALVIGNGAYQTAPALATPVNDANAVAGLLRDNGFDVVELKTDLGNTDFKRLLREFAPTMREADVAVLYFGGHGVRVGGANYLLPVDAKLESDLDTDDEAVSLDRVMKMMQGGKGLRVVLLDAARDNPLVRSMQRTKGEVAAGLARFEPEADDTFIVYAARPGTLAVDIPGERGAFAQALVKNLAAPGRDLRTAIGFARDDVIQATGGKQEVVALGAFGGRALALVPAPKAAAAPPTRQIAILPAQGEAERQPNAGAEAAAGPQRIAVLPAPGAPPPAQQQAVQQPPAPQNVAAAPPPAAEPEPKPDAKPDAKSDPKALTRELQTELRRVGCDPGAVDGVWSPASRQALDQFNRRADMKFGIDAASPEALEGVKGQRGRICIAAPVAPAKQPAKKAAQPAPRQRVQQRQVVHEAPPRRRAVVVEEGPAYVAPPIGLGIGGRGIGIGIGGMRF